MRAIFHSVSLALTVVLLVSALSAGAQQPAKQGPPVPASFIPDSAVKFLHKKVNAYRRQNGLPPVALSRSLSYVAWLHATDLLINRPDQGDCNVHSWSDRGPWTPFCYPADETKKTSVWDKPRELTRYPARAYEIVYWENVPLLPDSVFAVWKSESYFNDFMLNRGKWLGRKWSAIGIALAENYACAWFGEVADPENASPVKLPPSAGKQKPVKPKTGPAVTAPPKQEVTIRDTTSAGVVKADSAGLAAETIPSTYYIIIKTNLKKDSAEKLAVSLRESGYPLARVLDADGKIRLSAFESSDRKLVMSRLREVKMTYKDAWMLKGSRITPHP